MAKKRTGRAVSHARRERPRSGGSGAVPAAHQHARVPAKRREARGKKHHAMSTVSAEVSGDVARSLERPKREKSAARGSAGRASKRPKTVDAKSASVQGRADRVAAATERRDSEGSSPSSKEGVGSAKRVRGTASLPCPECGSDTQVYRTRRAHLAVERERECVRCRYRFWTTETRST
jgi:DNA-directed RNA polymerase subunit M/transcription elongation factor TFIIS